MELDEVFADLAAAAPQLAPLNNSQRDAWFSGLAATWRTDIVVDDPTATDQQFSTWCAEAQDADGTLAHLARRMSTGALSDDVVSTGAWCVSATGLGVWQEPGDATSESIVIGFLHTDGSEHTVLAELSVPDEGAASSDRDLLDLQVGPPPDEVLPDRAAPTTAETFAPDSAPVCDDEDEDGAAPDVESWPVDAAARTVVEAWKSTWARVNGQWPGERGDSLLVNQVVVRSRLAHLTGESAATMADFTLEPEELVERFVGMTQTEIAEANQRSLETLHRALAGLRGTPAPGGATDLVAPMAEPMQAGPSLLSRDEREALAFLEWADWLGVVLGIMRSDPRAPLSGSAMVDHINRCPEVTSSIDKRDREFVTWAFEVALAWWNDIGATGDDGVLTPHARWALPHALAKSWGGDF